MRLNVDSEYQFSYNSKSNILSGIDGNLGLTGKTFESLDKALKQFQLHNPKTKAEDINIVFTIGCCNATHNLVEFLNMFKDSSLLNIFYKIYPK